MKRIKHITLNKILSLIGNSTIYISLYMPFLKINDEWQCILDLFYEFSTVIHIAMIIGISLNLIIQILLFPKISVLGVLVESSVYVFLILDMLKTQTTFSDMGYAFYFLTGGIIVTFIASLLPNIPTLQSNEVMAV